MGRNSKECLAFLCLVQLLITTIAVESQNVESYWERLESKRIDTHCHFAPEFYREILREKKITAGGRPIPAWNVTEHLAFMDKMNISFSIASVSTPGAVLNGHYPVEERRKLARMLNEYGYALRKQYPDRFGFFATLTLPDVEGSVNEAIYALDSLKAAGVVLLASSAGEVLGSRPDYEPLYAELDKRNAVVFVHPGQSVCSAEGDCPIRSSGVPPFAVDFLLDTTRAALNLVYSNVIHKYPSVKFILAHSGGFLPFATFRATKILNLLKNDSDSIVLSQLQQFYVDTAISGNEWALPSTLALLGHNHLTYGSDYPFAPENVMLENSLDTDRYFEQNLKAEALGHIRFSTASKLFGRKISVDSLCDD
ncbi:hypothetical protein R1flu_002921 [Riccia fluitans]|uniref:Amidohydrolase-related domain-containing protein n=1 Tax=Riccia fluitans TaxID=41844 RepID=A0ABD1Y7I0_9MARC